MVAVDGVVFFQVLDAAKAAYEVSDLYSAIMALSTTNLRTVMGSMDLDETLSKRDEINARLLVVVDQATESWGVKITRVEYLKEYHPVDRDHRIVLGDDLLPRDIEHLLHHVNFAAHAIEEGRVEIEAWPSDCGEAAEMFYRVVIALADDLDAGHQVDDDEHQDEE